MKKRNETNQTTNQPTNQPASQPTNQTTGDPALTLLIAKRYRHSARLGWQDVGIL